mgnify:CR=1 FL=1
MKTLALLAVAVFTAIACIGGCATNPATGKSQYSALSREQEIQMGAQAKPELIKEMGGELNNAEVKEYVTRIGNKLTPFTEGDNPTLPWTFTVVDSDIINAFALPGGQVFISKGLLKCMTNEAQLAGVLGHEIGHVTARHINDRIVSQTTTNITGTILSTVLSEGLGVGLGGMTPRVIEFGGQTLVMSFGRDEEIEADSLGMRYMSRAMYNPTGQRQVMQILEAEAKGDPNPEWLSTHPYPKTRIERIDRQLSGTYKAIVNDPAYVYNEAEFKAACLSKLGAMYNPADAPGPRLAAAGRYGWCAHCAAEPPGAFQPRVRR